MKKLGQIVLVFLLSVGMFTGCGTSYKADESTVFVLKDGKIVSTDVENFDEKTYDKDGLKEYVKNEIDTYNEKNGKGSVSLKKLDTGEKRQRLPLRIVQPKIIRNLMIWNCIREVLQKHWLQGILLTDRLHP